MTKLDLSAGVYDTSNLTSTEMQFSCGVCRKYWVTIDGVDYLFKANNGENEYDSLSNVGEVLYTYICKKVNLPCVNAIFATDFYFKEVKPGVLVENMLKKGERLVSYKVLFAKYLQDRNYQECDNTIDEIEKMINNLPSNFIVDKKQISKDLWNMFLMDYLFMQRDRHNQNIGFILNKTPQGTELRLAPMFDNGMCMYFFASSKSLKKIMLELKLSPDRKRYIERCNTVYMQFSKDFAYTPDDYAEQLAKKIVEDKDLRLKCYSFLKLDLKSTFQEIEDITGYQIDKNYKNISTMLFSHRKNVLFDKIKECKKELLEQSKPVEPSQKA